MRRASATACCALLLAACAADDAAVRPPPPVLDESPSGDLGWPLEPARPAPRPPLPPVGATAARGSSGLPAPADGADDALYVVGGRQIGESDLGDFLLRYYPDRAREALAQLVDVVLVEQEAARTGVTVPAAMVRARADEYVAERRAELRVRHGDDVSLEDLLAERYGRDLATFTRDAERLARVELMRDRLVRLDALAVPRVRIRVLVAPTAAEAADVAARLRAGADPTALAARLGMAAPVSPPPLAADEIRPAALSQALFVAAPGDVVGPFAFTGEDGGTWHQVVRLVERTEAEAGGWAQAAAGIERGLLARPVGVEEYLQWRRRAVDRRRVEVRAAGGMVPWARARSGRDDSGGAR